MVSGVEAVVGISARQSPCTSAPPPFIKRRVLCTERLREVIKASAMSAKTRDPMALAMGGRSEMNPEAVRSKPNAW